MISYHLVRAFAASTNVKEEVEVFIDGKSVMIEQGAALIQACEKAGADVCIILPTFGPAISVYRHEFNTFVL